MIESLLIRDIDILLGEEIRHGDMLIQDGKIAEIDWHLDRSAECVLNGSGLTVMPGVIDAHVHFRDPGLTHKEDFESGSKAAAAGGVTAIIDMPNTTPATVNAETLSEKKRIAREKSYIHYQFFVGATKENIPQLSSLENYAGIKLFMGSSTGDLLLSNDADLDALFQQTPNQLIVVHAEDQSIIDQNKQSVLGRTIFQHEQIRSRSAGLSAVQKIVYYAKKYQHRLHVLHVSSAEEIEFLRANKTDFITAEVTPQHLIFASPDVYSQYGTFAQVNPPIRGIRDQAMLWQGLRDGVIDTIGSDHAPHTLAEKSAVFGKAPSGMPMVELSLPILLNAVNQAQVTLPEISKWMSLNPAKLLGLTRKGAIQTGYDADIVLVDLKTRRTVRNAQLHTQCQWSLLNNQTLQGWPIMTLLNGQFVFREGDFYKGFAQEL